MKEQLNQIREGIAFEEDVIQVLLQDMHKIEAFQKLPGKAKEDIEKRLQQMISDSKRHKEILLAIAAKY